MKMDLTPTLMDRAVSFFSPARGLKRMRARGAMQLLGAYKGASRVRRALREWDTPGGSVDEDVLGDLDALRERSRDLVRNNPIAAGAIKTKLTTVIGPGFRMKSNIDRKALGINDDAAEALEAKIEREFEMFWKSKDLDISRGMNGHDLARMIYRQEKENGESFVLLTRLKRAGSPYDLRLQVIEADRIGNPSHAQDSDTMTAGVEKDATTGEPVAYHVCNSNTAMKATKWQRREAFSESTGLRNVIHFYDPTRPGQTRGIPDLAPVIEPLKQLGRYTDNEVTAAVISSMFTVFIESPTADNPVFDYSNLGAEVGQQAGDKVAKLGNGLIVELGEGEKVHDSNPGRPNVAFDPFVQAILRQIGAALEIPFELLIKHFTSSYSAARAALLALWQFVMTDRRRFVDNVLAPIYENWFYEAVAKDRIQAPGFFADPAVRAAYLGAQWIGPSKGQINEMAEVSAAKRRVESGFSTIAYETAELTGGDWERNHPQQVKENKARIADGLTEDINRGMANE